MSLDERSFANDIAGNAGTNGWINFGDDNAVSGTVGGTDTDWYQIHTDVGSTYSVVMNGPAGGNFDIRDSAGNILDYGVASAGVEDYTFNAAATKYFIEVTSPVTGAYSVNADNLTTPTGAAMPLSVNASVSGNLTVSGQNDVYTVNLTAGTSYDVSLINLTLADPFLVVEGPQGDYEEYLAVTSGQNVTFAAPTSGTYTLNVSSDSYVGQGAYTLVENAVPTAVSSAAAIPSGTPAVITPTGVQAATIPAGPYVNVTDTSTGVTSAIPTTPYGGPVTGLTQEYINLSPDNLNITATTPGVFLHSGAGEDALQVLSGNNVMDGGTGSNFLVGGTGTDTFFLDARGASADIWSTLVNFHSGDSATIWGLSASNSNIGAPYISGAAGYTGFTETASAPGTAHATITLSGYTLADVTNGRLVTSFGYDPASGSSYAYIHAN